MSGVELKSCRPKSSSMKARNSSVGAALSIIESISGRAAAVLRLLLKAALIVDLASERIILSEESWLGCWWRRVAQLRQLSRRCLAALRLSKVKLRWD